MANTCLANRCADFNTVASKNNIKNIKVVIMNKKIQEIKDFE